jgi:Maltose operon periplasmic protein precursor (MalM)
MRITSTLVVVCTLASLSGCQTTRTSVVEREAAPGRPTAQTVSSLRELTATPIVFTGESDTVQVRTNMLSEPPLQKVQQLEGEPIFAALYSLPEFKSAYSVRITASVLGDRQNPTVYYPRMVFLDETFAVTRHTTQKDFRFRANGTNGVISATIFVNEQNRNDRYMVVVEEPPKDVAEQLSLIAGQAPPPMVLPFALKLAEIMWVVGSTSNEPERRLRAARAGVYELSFTPYKVRKLGE